MTVDGEFPISMSAQLVKCLGSASPPGWGWWLDVLLVGAVARQGVEWSVQDSAFGADSPPHWRCGLADPQFLLLCHADKGPTS